MKLLKDSPYCHWCKCEVRKFKPGPGRPPPEWAATLDHYYAKGDKRRGGKTPIPRVLCCYGCNQKRGDMKPEDWENKLGNNQGIMSEV